MLSGAGRLFSFDVSDNHVHHHNRQSPQRHKYAASDVLDAAAIMFFAVSPNDRQDVRLSGVRRRPLPECK